MALKTESDYQDEIDDLKKEIDRLYDEGTDKGFRLKREEEMDFEVKKQEALNSLEARARIETERDYKKGLAQLKKIEFEYEEHVKQEKELLKKENELENVLTEIQLKLGKIDREKEKLEKALKELAIQLSDYEDKHK